MVQAYGKTYALGFDGQFYTVGGVTDSGGTIRRVAVGDTVEINGNRFRVSLAEARARAGFQSSEANIMLRTSKDRGVTWSSTKQRSIGGQGAYRDRAVWRQLGQFRTLTMELSQSDSADIPLFADVRLDVA